MPGKKLTRKFLEQCKLIKSKRPKTVIDHILKHGFITTQELKEKYGYNHPPRAARDVREEGIPLETFRVVGSDGRKIGAYRFGDPSKIQEEKLGGRKVVPKKFKESLLQALECKCSVCLEKHESRYLQVDHRVPYEVSGDMGSKERNITNYMLLCGSCNRAKSWSCEHCVNWLEEKAPKVCDSCYWAYPESYKHIALSQTRRLDIELALK